MTKQRRQRKTGTSAWNEQRDLPRVTPAGRLRFWSLGHGSGRRREREARSWISKWRCHGSLWRRGREMRREGEGKKKGEIGKERAALLVLVLAGSGGGRSSSGGAGSWR